jgi:hypothetical protein
MIDADELLKALGFEESKRGMVRPGSTFDVILNAPTIDAEPVRHGRWEAVNSAYWRWYPEGARVVNRVTYRCSRCGRGAITKTDYCTCGAKMDGGGEA